MPRRKTIKVYKFAELDPKVRSKVLDRFREHAFDAEHISEQFDNILEERGFEKPDVCWSLNYSQGDGVAFSGHVYSTPFFEWAIKGDDPAYQKRMMESGVEKFLPLQKRCSIKVTNSDRRYCHWNSMDVEVNLDVNFVDLVPDGIQDEVLRYLEIKGNLYQTFEREKYVADQARLKPIREWQRRMETWRLAKERGPKAWRPKPGQEPPPADVPEPSFALPEAPPGVLEAIAKAEAEWSVLDKLVTSFQEYLEEWVQDVSRELEKLGYEESEYQQADEQIIEMIEANDYEFLENGSISK